MLKCLQRIKQLAESVGASLDEDHESGVVVDAPVGYVWNDNLASCLYEACENRSQSWRAQACRDIETRMMLGLRKCDEDESRSIGHERDEEWVAADDAPEELMPTVPR